MSEIQRSSFRVIFLAATILTLFLSSSLSADIKTLRKQAEAGDAKAQFNIGSMYENGSGVKQDYAEAAKWYRRAAERGDARAQYNLGIFHQNGWGVPKDDAEAAKWYRKAAMQGAASAQYNQRQGIQKICQSFENTPKFFHGAPFHWCQVISLPSFLVL